MPKYAKLVKRETSVEEFRKTASGVADLVGLLAELPEVLAGAVVGGQPVRLREPPAREPHGHPAVHPAELPAALGAGPRRPCSHRLDLLQPVPAGLAGVL